MSHYSFSVEIFSVVLKCFYVMRGGVVGPGLVSVLNYVLPLYTFKCVS